MVDKNGPTDPDLKYRVRRSNYEIIKEAVWKVYPDAEEVRMKIAVLDYDDPYELHFDVTLNTHPGSACFNVDEFLSYINNLHDVSILDQKENKSK